MGVRRILGVVSGLVIAAVMPATAAASGSGTIAAAPTVTYGQQEFGNTLTDSQSDCLNTVGPVSWWLLPATAGDRITIDFEETGQQDFSEQVFPPATNDYNFMTTNSFQEETNHSGRAEAVFTIPQSGTWPLQFIAGAPCGGEYGGPYDFTAYVAHKVVVALGARSDTRKHQTAFTTSLHSPDGTPITSSTLTCSLQRRISGKFVTIAHSSPPCRSTVRWAPRLRDTTQIMRIGVAGSGYLSASKTIRVKAQ